MKDDKRKYDLRHIIGRASELDDQTILDAAEVRAIAAELGISAAAVESALEEAESSGVMRLVERKDSSDAADTGVAVGVAAAGAVVLLATSVTQGFDGVVTAAMFTAMATLVGDLWFASRIRGSRRLLRFMLVNAATWTVLGAALGSLAGALGMTAFAIGAGAGGAVLISLRDRALMKRLGLLDAPAEISSPQKDGPSNMQFHAMLPATR